MEKFYYNVRKMVLGSLLGALSTSLSLKAQVIVQTFNYTGSIQTFVVPQLCVSTITIEAIGAGGGSVVTTCSATGGLGASMKGEFSVVSGQTLLILVGQAGQTNGSDAGGGGGSFVTTSSSVALVVAGGGGGASNNIGQCGNNRNGLNASITTSGTAGASGGGFGGTGGNGGTGTTGSGGAGGGFVTNGTITGFGFSFLNGGAGGPGVNFDGGGYGGGGAGWFTGGNGGGGGGYSGGGTSGAQPYAGGGGGGSFNSGSNQVNTAGVRQGNGSVIISYSPGIPIITGISNSNICTGGSTTLSAANMVTYTWSTGSNTSSISVSPTVTTVYTVQGTNSAGCVSNGTLGVTVFSATPSLSITNNNTVVCSGKTAILTASGAVSYTWTNGITNAALFTPTTTTVYTVTGGNPCGTNTAATSITVNPVPSITASVNNPTVCSGSNIILNGSGGVGNYTWTAGAPNNLAFVPPGTTTYSVTGTSVNGCTATAAVGVTVLVTPTITPVVTPTAICFGTNAVLSAIGATGYTWTPGTNLFASTATVSPPSSTTFTLFRTNGACSSTSTLNLVVNPLPLVNATASPSQICAGAGINLVVLGPVTNTWQPGGFTQSNLMVYPNFSTSYTVTGSNGSCTAQSIVPIVVNSSPIISIASSTNIICQGNSSTLTVSGTGAAPLTYTWGSGNNGTTEIVTPNSTTIITVSATNTLNCTSTLNQLIQVNPVPNMSLTANPSFICAGDQAVLSIAQATASTNNNVAYIWSTGGTGPNITASPTITTIYNTVGTNTLTGCQNSNSVTLAVYIATFSIISPTAICKGQTATLTAVGQPTSYVWTVVNGNNTAPSVTVSPVINTTYSVTGVNGSCNTSSQVAVIVNPIPNVTAIAAKNQICKFEISTITANGATSYSWSTGAVTQAISFTLSVTTNYTLTGTDLNGCAKTVTVSQFVATCLGIEDAEMGGNAGINVYPNPNNGNFTISSDKNITLNIINALGQTVNTIKLSEENKKEITVGSLPTGIYFISGDADGTKVNKKIIVER